MFLQKDELSKFNFISVKEFLLALFLMFVTTVFSFLLFPLLLRNALPTLVTFLNSRYFDIFLFFLSALLSFYVIYFFSCKLKQKSLQEGLFLYFRSKKAIIYSVLIGILMPLLTLPIMLKFAPKEFYAMNFVKSKEGLIYLFACASVAPIFEEIFYRGFIFPFFQSKLNSFWAVIITGVFFGLSHFMNIGNAHILLSLFMFYGFVITLIRYFTNSLIPPIITHFFHNATLMISFLIVSR